MIYNISKFNKEKIAWKTIFCVDLIVKVVRGGDFYNRFAL